MNQLAESPLAMLQGVLVGDDADEEQHQRGRQQVERRAADGLVGAQVDRRRSDSSSENSAPMAADTSMASSTRPCSVPQSPAALAAMKVSTPLHLAHKEHADERAEDHDALECEVDDAAALGKHAGERHDHERDGIDQGLLDEKAHACSPPSAMGASASGSVMAGSGCRSGSPSDCAGSTG